METGEWVGMSRMERRSAVCVGRGKVRSFMSRGGV